MYMESQTCHSRTMNVSQWDMNYSHWDYHLWMYDRLSDSIGMFRLNDQMGIRSEMFYEMYCDLVVRLIILGVNL